MNDYLNQEEDDLTEFDEDTISEDFNRSDIQKLEILEVLETTLNDTFQHIPSKFPQLRLPVLTIDLQMAVLANIAKKVKVLWPAVNEKPMQPAPSTMAMASEEIKRVALEATISTDTLLTEEMRQRFWSLQRSLNQVSSKSPDYGACATLLNFDHSKPIVEKRELLPHQVSGVAWLLLMLASPYHSGLLCDDVGLGKTTTVLALLSIRSTFAAHPELQKEKLEGPTDVDKLTVVNLLSPAPYKPTPILFPSSAALAWKHESKKFPSLTLFYYMGSSYRSSTNRSKSILPTKIEDFKKWIASLDSMDPQTASVVVLSTYATWHHRTLYFEGDSGPQAQKGSSRTKEHAEDETAGGQDDEDDATEMKEEQMRSLRTHASGLFDLVVCDECHKLKTVKTRSHQSVYLAEPKGLIMLTATPTINKHADFYGILCLFAGVVGSRESLPIDNYQIQLRHFDEAFENLKSTTVNLIDHRKYMPIINPETFRRLAGGGSQMPAGIAGRLLPPILSLIQLRRVKGEVIPLDSSTAYTIGAGIPAYRIVTVELKMTKNQEKMYQAGHRTMAPKLNKGGGTDQQGKPEPRINMTAHRWLCLLSINPAFDRIKSRAHTSSLKLQKSFSKEDFGATFYHTATRLESWCPAYRDRVSWALYISGTSPKIQWLAGQVLKTCYVSKKKLLIFCAWPCSQWYIEMFLNIIGVKSISIRACHSLSEREAAMEAWNNVDDDAQVLVSTYAMAGISMNLHESCSDLVMAEPPESANIALQCIGRVFCIGQKSAQNIWMLTTNHTYDQVVQARAARKMYGQIAE